MPIYEYECPKCGHVFEEWGKASEDHKKEPCPVCGTPSPRVISRTSFVLKGNGWYVSDYGYRKGISEDSGAGADAPAPATPTTPAKQGEKAIAKQGDKSLVAQGDKSVAVVKEKAAPKKEEAAPKAESKKTEASSGAKS